MEDRHWAKVIYLLLELLVNGIERILDRDTLHVPRSDFEAEWEVKVDLLDGRFGEHLLQDRRVLDGACGGVDLPGRQSADDQTG